MASTIWCSRKCIFEEAAAKCAKFDNLGVPNAFLPRIAAFFFDESLFQSYLEESIQQKLLELFTEFVSARDFSDESIVQLFRHRNAILVKPYKELSKKLALESAKALSSLNDSMDAHLHNLDTLEAEILSLFENDAPKEEILQLVTNSFSDMKSSLETNIDNLRTIAFFDPTSGLANRHSFNDFFGQATAMHREGQAHIGLAMLDIDNFKRFNDTYGHRVGDQVIALVGREIKTFSERVEDAHTRFFTARFGGEEFAIVASGPRAQFLPALTVRICKAIARFNFLIRDAVGNVLKDNVHISLSAGVVLSSVPHDCVTCDYLTERADGALYTAKDYGKNCVVLCCNSQEIPYVVVSR